MLFGILWIIVLTTFYFWVFRAVSYGTNREVLFRGAAFAFPPAAILVLRGITAWLKTSRKLDDGRGRCELLIATVGGIWTCQEL